MSMEHWWNDTDRRNYVPREKHYTAWVVDVGMNEYRAFVI